MTDKDVELMTRAGEVALDEIAAQEAVEDERHKTEYTGDVLEVNPPFIYPPNCDRRSHLLTAIH